VRRGSRLVKLGVLVLLALMVCGGIGIGSYLYIRSQQIEETQEFSDELRNGLVASCERNGNPLREAVQKMLREQIRSSEQTPQSFFPNIPPEVFEDLIRERVRANRQIIHQIAPVDCAALYPRP
jgi:hypothetical protein